ncbi:MAG: hypothetical protein H7Y31_05100 [Chitinophagaceae bacterium]|nr:hypothetical protein [Chitinophagaceae bacterium]
MAGRGDNNKKGSAGRGAGNQSNQAFAGDGQPQPKSDHAKNAQQGTASEPQPKQEEGKSKNIEIQPGGLPNSAGKKETFNLMVDDAPYIVSSEPFRFNDEVRYIIKVNEGIEHVFTWDSDIKGLRAIDDDAAGLPSSVEEAISARLQSRANG